MGKTWLKSRFINIDLDELLAYETIKLVRIKDRRLGALHYTLMIGIFVYIVAYTIVYQQRYMLEEMPYGSIRSTLQEPPEWKDPATLPYCLQNQSTYDGHENYECVYMLGLDISFPTALMGVILASTRIKDTFYPYTDPNCTLVYPAPATTLGCAPLKNTSTSKRYWINDIEDYTVYIEHSVFADENDIVATNKDCIGTLLYRDGSGRSITLTDDTRQGDIFPIQTFLDASNNPTLDVLSDLDDNDTLRYDGLLLMVVIDYSNTVWNPTHLDYTYSLYTIPGVNVISQEPSAPVAGGVSQRSWYGVRLIFLITGTLGRFDFPTLLTSLVNGVVLIKVSTLVVDMLLVYVMPDKQKYREHKFEVTEEFTKIRRASEAGLRHDHDLNGHHNHHEPPFDADGKPRSTAVVAE